MSDESVSPDDETQKLDSIYPVIQGDIDYNSDFAIVIEGQIVSRIKGEGLDCVAARCLMGRGTAFLSLAKTVQQESIMSLAQANNHLAVHLHRLLSKENENIFFSPFSISVAMGMLLCAAEGETASELRTVLGHEQAGINKDDVATVFEQQMTLLLQPNDSYTLSCANSMLSQKGFDVKDEYKKILAESFRALALEVDFQRENEKAVIQINEWVKEKTNNMIPKLVQSLDPSTVLVLLNAVYFKGTWKKQFEKKSTYAQIFYNKGENGKNIEMMHKKESFPFHEDKSFKVLQLPYIGEEIAMMIILPHAKNGINEIEANLSPSFIQDLKKKLWRQKVKITLPRFRLECTKSLIPYFSELGVKCAFNRGAELTVASNSPDLAVSDILHKAVIDVNEEGSEAAAATMVSVMMCSMPLSEPEFIADHPFMFVIYNATSDLILFMGRVNEL